MRYLMLVCAGEQREAAEMMTIEDWVAEMDGRGVRALGRALDDPRTAVTVRMRDGEPLVADGPFAETKEFVAGFDVIECADLDEAIEVASRHPVAGFGAIEVRPFTDATDLDDGARRWGAEEPTDSWALFFCVDGNAESDAAEAAIARDSEAWLASARERGVFVYGGALDTAETATTVRVTPDGPVLTDGPFVETTEFIGGVGILHGVDREQAIELAATHPLAAYHRVEARRFAD